MNNKWVLKDNQHSSIIKHYLDFSKMPSLDTLVSIQPIELEVLLIKYGNSLTHRWKESTVENKLRVILMFYSFNGIEIDIFELLEEIDSNTSHLRQSPSTTK